MNRLFARTCCFVSTPWNCNCRHCGSESEDIPVLAGHFLEGFKRKYHKPNLEFTSKATQQLQANRWRGNVRELRHAIERAVILCEGDQLTAEPFVEINVTSAEPELQLDTCNLEAVERQAVEQSLRKHRGNISKAAKELGITRASLYRRMEKHDL